MGRRGLMLSMSGRVHVMSASIIRLPLATFLRTWLATKISMNTGAGKRLRITARCGHRLWLQVGLLITTVAGSGSLLGAGPGLKQSLGDTLHSTTADGYIRADTGVGLPDRSGSGRTTRRHWSPGLAARAG